MGQTRQITPVVRRLSDANPTPVPTPALAPACMASHTPLCQPEFYQVCHTKADYDECQTMGFDTNKVEYDAFKATIARASASP
mgnify:CR=1 FL=1